jgi:hypothetical protein
VSSAATARNDLFDLFRARATIRSRVAGATDLLESFGPTTHLFADASVRDGFADADEHGSNLALKVIFKAGQDRYSRDAKFPQQLNSEFTFRLKKR